MLPLECLNNGLDNSGGGALWVAGPGLILGACAVSPHGHSVDVAAKLLGNFLLSVPGSPYLWELFGVPKILPIPTPTPLELANWSWEIWIFACRTTTPRLEAVRKGHRRGARVRECDDADTRSFLQKVTCTNYSLLVHFGLHTPLFLISLDSPHSALLCQGGFCTVLPPAFGRKNRSKKL